MIFSMRNPFSPLCAALGLALLLAMPAAATTIVPAADPGELALDSEAVFLARAGAARVVSRPNFLMTETEFEVLTVVSGPLVADESIRVAVPGGEIDGVGWLVAGSPRFVEGEAYLIFADRGGDGSWRPRLLADGVLRRKREADGTPILVPMEEARRLNRIGTTAGASGLIPAPVVEARFLDRLRRSLAGEAGWEWKPLMAPFASTWLELKEAPAGCVFPDGPQGYAARWKKFDLGSSQSLWADDKGEASIEGGGFAQVEGAVGIWMGVDGTTLNLVYSGPKPFTLDCNLSSGIAVPGPYENIVVFDDPCDDIDDLVNCSGTLALGGPFITGVHQFDGRPWWTIVSWFVVVNDGVGGGCLDTSDFELMLARELGHGLGFDTSADPQSLMNTNCCNPLNALDASCAQYLYPAWELEPGQATVPVVAYVNGVGGTPWRTDVTITNPTSDNLLVDLTYQPGGEAPITETRSVGGMASLFFDDIVPTLFGAGDGRGPLRVQFQGAGEVLPVIVSRTYAERSFGSLGAGVPADVVPAVGFFQIPGLFVDDAYRSNVSVTADVGSFVDAVFKLYRGDDGTVSREVRRTVPAGEQEQWALDKLFPSLARDGVPMTVTVRLEQPGIASASVVDNASTDSAVYLGKKSSTSWIIPVVAHIPGKGGTVWTSEVSLYNQPGSPTTVNLEYLPENTDNSAGGLESAEISLGWFETVTLEDVVRNLFGVSNGKGALRIEAPAAITVTSRVATAGPRGGTSGNGVRTVHGGAWSTGRVVLPGVRMRDGFRTNVGFVSGSEAVTLLCSLLDADGSILAEASVAVEPRSMRQLSVEKIFGSSGYPIPDPVGAITVEGAGAYLAYMTVIDGTSQDPVFVMPK